MAQPPVIRPVGDALGVIDLTQECGAKQITVIGTENIRRTFDARCLEQAVTTRLAPGVSQVVLNPDAHVGYGAPIGCVMVSPTHIYPGPVGVDIKCSMSLLQLDLPAAELRDRRVRRALIEAVCERIPTGPGKGQRSVKKARHVSKNLGERVIVQGASSAVCEELGIPSAWIERCEDSFHLGHDGTRAALEERVGWLQQEKVISKFEEKLQQLGSYGGGNHFGEANIVSIASDTEAQNIAKQFGLQDQSVSFLSHCGSRGFGFQLANHQFRVLQHCFQQNGRAFPGNDKQLVYAELGTNEANDYLDDMALGANFATVNHLLINALVLEAFNQVLPGVKGSLVYFISHNIARSELIAGREVWVHRKGATRAYPANHHSLRDTVFATTGHPILLPGNPRSGSVVMRALPGSEVSCFSVNHGAGRALGRRAAFRALDQHLVDKEFADLDILNNCRQYPLDEAPAVYKDFNEVVKSVELAGLAQTVAELKATFVIKDGDTSLGGAA